MRRSSVVAIAVALLLIGWLPVLAQDNEPSDPLIVLLDAIDAPEGQEFVLQVAETLTEATNDARGDFEHASGEEPGYTPDHIDILETSVIKLETGPVEVFGPTSVGGLWASGDSSQVETQKFGAIHTFTGAPVEHDGSQYGEAVVFVITLAETPPTEVPAPM